MSASIRHLDGQTSKGIQAGLLYPSLSSILLALSRHSLLAKQVSRIALQIKLSPEWEISCHDDAKGHRNSGDLFWQEIKATSLSLLAYLGVLDVQKGLRKHIQSGDDVIFSGLIDERLRSHNALESGITIRDIFRNIPVRRRLLFESTTARLEIEKCRKALAIISVAFPKVHLTFQMATSGDENMSCLLDTHISSSLASRYEQLFHLPVNDPSFATSFDSSITSRGVKVKFNGFVVHALLASKSHQHVILDGRLEEPEEPLSQTDASFQRNQLKPFIIDILKESFIASAASSLNSTNHVRHLGFFLDITAGGNGVSNQELFAAVKSVLKNQINKDESEGARQTTSIRTDQSGPTESPVKRARLSNRRSDNRIIEAAFHDHQCIVDRSDLIRQPNGSLNENMNLGWLKDTFSRYKPKKNSSKTTDYNLTAAPEEDVQLPNSTLDYVLHRDNLTDSRAIGQVDAKFICILTKDDTMVLMDQHAAHERVRLEAILSEYIDTLYEEDESNTSTVSVNLTDSVNEIFAREQVKGLMRSWGFKYNIISNTESKAIQFTNIPESLKDKLRYGQAIESFTDRIATYLEDERDLQRMHRWTEATKHVKGGDKSWSQALRYLPEPILDLFNSISCRGAIMFNDVLSFSQCETLLVQLADTTFPFQCAHGRPSLLPMCKLSILASLQAATPINWKSLA